MFVCLSVCLSVCLWTLQCPANYSSSFDAMGYPRVPMASLWPNGGNKANWRKIWAKKIFFFSKKKYFMYFLKLLARIAIISIRIMEFTLAYLQYQVGGGSTAACVWERGEGVGGGRGREGQLCTFYISDSYLLDVLWCQPIKLIHVVSTSEFHEYWWNDIDFICFVPSI